MDEKWKRVEAANEVIALIAKHGRQFFRDSKSGRIAKFELDKKGRVFFRDAYTDKLIYTHWRGTWWDFSQGGTMRSVVEHLRDHIRLGNAVPIRIFGPFPGWICGGDPWGYGADMARLRDLVRRTGVVWR